MLTVRRKIVHAVCLLALFLTVLAGPQVRSAYAEPVSAPTETACVQ